MDITVLDVAGYFSAKYGFSLSYKDRSVERHEWFPCTIADSEEFYRLEQEVQDKIINRITHYDDVLESHAHRDGGHNKFLEHIMVWLDIEATLEWWKQFDTYRIGVSKQSESTMHTLHRRDLNGSDFDITLDGDNKIVFEMYVEFLNTLSERERSKCLPQCYLQRREVVLNYKVLRHIINQRSGHKLPEWMEFIDQVLTKLPYRNLLRKVNKDENNNDL